jgi:hypothetical protein
MPSQSLCSSKPSILLTASSSSQASAREKREKKIGRNISGFHSTFSWKLSRRSSRPPVQLVRYRQNPPTVPLPCTGTKVQVRSVPAHKHRRADSGVQHATAHMHCTIDFIAELQNLPSSLTAHSKMSRIPCIAAYTCWPLHFRRFNQPWQHCVIKAV